MTNRTLYQILQASKFSKTLSEVGEKLYLSQPYISKVLKNAEKEYNTTLIERKSSPITLTASGLIVLQHLSIIMKTEEDLFNELKNKNIEDAQPTKILVTNPFLYSMVLDLLTQYTKNNKEFTFELSSFPIQDALKIIKAHGFDIIIGRRYIDTDITTIPLPQNKVYCFISKQCQIYDSSKIILPFEKEYLDEMKNSKLVTFENSEGICDYILKRFKEVGINIYKIIKVDSVRDACLTAKQLGHDAMALVGNYLAQKEFGKGNYNLLSLPNNTLHFDNAIMYSLHSQKKIIDLAKYLENNLFSLIKTNNL